MKTSVFNLNGLILYGEEVLVEYECIPLLYVCKDEHENFYTILRVYLDKEEYLITLNSNEDIKAMLLNEITMRELFLKGKACWYVKAETATVQPIDISDVPKEILPLENDYLDVETSESKKLLQKLSPGE